MPFGSRRFLTGGASIPTRISFSGDVNNCGRTTITDDFNGNTVLGNGSYSATNDLVHSAGGPGGFSNAPMVILLTPNRNYTIVILRTDGKPNVDTNVAATTANLQINYGRVVGLSNPPYSYGTGDSPLANTTFAGGDIGSGEPDAGYTFTFDNAPWVDNKIVMVQGLSVLTTHNATSGSIGANHTPYGLSVNWVVAQSGLNSTGAVELEVSEI